MTEKQITAKIHQGEILLPGEDAYVLRGWMYGCPYKHNVESIEEAVSVAGYACDENTWAAEELVDSRGNVVMTRKQLLDAYEKQGI